MSDYDPNCPNCAYLKVNLNTQRRENKEYAKTSAMIIEKLKQDNRLLASHRDQLVELLNTYIKNEKPLVKTLADFPIEKLKYISEILSNMELR